MGRVEWTLFHEWAEAAFRGDLCVSNVGWAAGTEVVTAFAL